jgi:hypothetical protein
LELGAFEDLDLAGSHIGRREKQFELFAGPHLGKVDGLFQMIAQGIDIERVEVIRAGKMGDQILAWLSTASAS